MLHCCTSPQSPQNNKNGIITVEIDQEKTNELMKVTYIGNTLLESNDLTLMASKGAASLFMHIKDTS